MAGLSLPSPYPFPTSLSADLASLLPHNKEHLHLPGDHLEERQHLQHIHLSHHRHLLDRGGNNEKQFKQEVLDSQ